MSVLFVGGFATRIRVRGGGQPDRARSSALPGGNMEGKETRFGIAASALFATVTTDTSCGAVNSMHDSFTPLGGLVPLANLQLGEVIFGGVGTGPLRHARLRRADGLHRGLDGRPHAGVSREEDRAARSQLAILRDSRPADLRAASRRQSPPCSPSGSRRSATTARTDSREILYMFTRRPRTTAAPLPASAATRTSTSLTGVAMFFGRFLFIIPVAGAGRLAGGEEERSGDRRDVQRPTRRSSSCS